jgi:translocation and assembly module TamA
MPRYASSSARLICLLLAGLAAGRAGAAIKVEVEGVDGDLRRNVTTLLSVERYRERERIAPDAVERLFRRVEPEVREALRPFGYYEPEVESTLEALDKDENWRVRIRITPGTPVLVDQVSVTVDGPGSDDPVFTQITSNLPLKSGDRLQHPLYEQIKRGLQAAAATYGYLDARLTRSELQVDAEAHTASIYLSIETGERYRFGATTIKQSVIRDEELRRFLRYQEGEPYDANAWLRTQFALDDSQYFSNVSVVPGERDTTTYIVPMQISAEPAHRTFPIAAGYGTDTGVRGTVSWYNPRVNSLGHRLQMRMQASEQEQTFNTLYTIPIRDPARERITLNFTASDERVSSSVRTSTVSLTPGITQVLGRWQRALSVAAAHTTTRDTVNGRQTVDLIVPGITYASVPEGYLGEDLLTRALYIELLGSHTALGAKSNFLRVDIQSERQIDIRPLWHLLMRGQFGSTAIRADGAIPGQYRFFAGGDRSVRGFGFDELSPVTLSSTGQQQRIGGRHLITGTLEVQRDISRGIALATFVDFGNALNRFQDPLAWSTGLGIRWLLPGITLGLDVAQAVRAPGYDKLPGPRLHVNISPRSVK